MTNVPPQKKKSIFEFHTGFSLHQDDEQSVMDCPFCGKEEKFHFNREGLWDCKAGVCKKSGNAFTFIRAIYDHFETKTFAADMLRDIWHIPTEYSLRNGIKYNTLNNSVLFPAFKYDKVQSLYKGVQTQVFNDNLKQFQNKLRIYAPPSDMGVEHCLIHWPETTADIVWIAEGHRDKLSAEAIIGSTHAITITAVPGAGVWKPSWCELLDGKHVVFLYDNDASGRSGYERVILKEIAKSRYKPKSIQYLSWPTNLPDGYDLSDLYLDTGRKAYEFIDEHLKVYSAPENTVVVKETIESIAPDYSCDTWDELVRRFKATYHVTADMEMCLAAMLCALYSLQIDGEQLWYKVIGPPGCGKTTLAKLIAACSQTVLRSIITGLFSGWKDDSTEDASLAATISNKCLCIKDADTLIKQPNAAQIFSEFRDFYDKDSSTQFKNRIHFDYRNVRSSIILCGTNVLRSSDHSFLGERFLDYELNVTAYDERQIKLAVRRNTVMKAMHPDTPSTDLALQSSVKGFVEGHLMSRRIPHPLTFEQEEMIDRLATLVAQMRTDVSRDMGGKGEITFSPVVEVPSRLLGQLMKVSMIMPAVTGDTRYQESIVKKFAKDIIDPTSNRFRVCLDLREGWFSRDALVESSGLHRSTVTRILDDLRALRFVEGKEVGTGVGRRRLEFTLKEDMKEGLSLLGA